MFIQVWYFLTLTLTSLLMGTSFAHTLEMPAKMNVESATQTASYSPTGASVESARSRHGIYLISCALTVGFLSGARRHFVWPCIFRRLAGITNPLNAETAKWTASSIRRME